MNSKERYDPRLIRVTLALSGVTILAGVICSDPLAALMAVAGCLSCATMLEENYRRQMPQAAFKNIFD